MLEILGKTKIDFMGQRRWAFMFSGIMVVLGLVALIQIGRGAANLGIDFSGGTAVQLKFDQPIRIDEARKILEANGLGNAELQEFGQENKLLIRLKASTTIEEKVADRVVAVFTKEFSSNHFVIDSSTEIGPTIGQKLQGGCSHCDPHFLFRDHYLRGGAVRASLRYRRGVGDLS